LSRFFFFFFVRRKHDVLGSAGRWPVVVGSLPTTLRVSQYEGSSAYTEKRFGKLPKKQPGSLCSPE